MKKLRKIKAIHNEIWKYFSEWTRRNEKGKCFTCDTQKDWREMHAGHYIHGKLDYEPTNVHCQCAGCNTFRHGNLGIYSERMVIRYGIEYMQELRRRANTIWKPSRAELEQLRLYWKVKVEELGESQ